MPCMYCLCIQRLSVTYFVRVFVDCADSRRNKKQFRRICAAYTDSNDKRMLNTHSKYDVRFQNLQPKVK